MLLESEAAGNRQIAAYLTGIGHPTTPEQSMANFMGLAGPDFHAAVERWIGGPLPDGFHEARRAEDDRVLREGLDAVTGAIDFVRALPPTLPRAIVSSSSTRWIATHLAHLRPRQCVRRPPLQRARACRAWQARTRPLSPRRRRARRRHCRLRDHRGFRPSAATGAVASGGYVIGLCAGSHCAPNHAARLRAIGVDAVAGSFAEVAALLA